MLNGNIVEKIEILHKNDVYNDQNETDPLVQSYDDFDRLFKFRSGHSMGKN